MKKEHLKWIFVGLALVCALILVIVLAVPKTGWQEKDGDIYYLKDGEPVTGWLELEDKVYFFDETGKMCTGWKTLEEETYYFDSEGIMATGWLELDGNRYYLRQQGSLVTGWLSIDGSRYYLRPDGSAATGVSPAEGRRYVFDKNGLLTSGWMELDGKRSYGDTNGHPLTGWQEIDGIRYYFHEDGTLATGWLELDGFTYYFEEDGTPVQGKQTISGQNYHFASNGQLTILVNPWNYVPDGYDVELTQINDLHQVAWYAYDDFDQMMTDCENAGLDPVVCSSFRTQEYQEGLFQRRIERYMDEGYTEEVATELAGHSVAIPGTSEHQLGLALDIIDNANWNLDESQARMPTQKWLMEHSWEYGWILRYPDDKSEITGIIYEPWHYRYVGREIAAEIHELDICLEEYLEMLTNSTK